MVRDFGIADAEKTCLARTLRSLSLVAEVSLDALRALDTRGYARLQQLRGHAILPP